MAIKKLSEMFRDIKNEKRKYHLSYDVINLDENFDGKYDEAKKLILYAISKTDPLDIKSFNASSLIIEYSEPQSKLHIYLKKNLAKYFNFSLSLIDVVVDKGKLVHLITSNPNTELNDNFQEYLNSIDASTIKHDIDDY